MRVFFDQNVPRGLAQHLTGHQVTRAAELDWQELKNGELLAQVEVHGFEVFVSCDRNLAYQQRTEGRKIAIVALSTNNWPLVKKHTAEVAQAGRRRARQLPSGELWGVLATKGTKEFVKFLSWSLPSPIDKRCLVNTV